MALRLTTGTEPTDDEKKAELTEHLAELRVRLIRSFAYIAVGVLLVYLFHGRVQAMLMAPINSAVSHLSAQQAASGLPKGSYAFSNLTDPFFLILQISMIGGLVVAVPLIVLELWGFIAPALTPTEKRGVVFVAPLSVLLFILGASIAYHVLPFAVGWFLSFLPPNAVLLQNPLTFVVLAVKMLLVFGVCFELPVVLMFLGKIGLITSKMMIQYWRYITVSLFTVAMVVAPSNDLGTMLALAVPLTLLFFASIWLVKLVEPKA